MPCPNGIATGHGRLEVEEIHVAVKYGGRVDEVLVDEGDMVEAGDVLARLDTAELDANFARAAGGDSTRRRNPLPAPRR